MSTFKPYRKSNVKPEVDKTRADLTNAIEEALQGLIHGYDCYPAQGAITIKDAEGRLWEISIERSDAKWLAGERLPRD